MHLPFTEEQFLAVFDKYNHAIWPLQALTWIAAVLCAAYVAFGRRSARGNKAVLGVTAVFWAIAGVGYFLLHFTKLSPLGWVFGAAFLVQSAFLLVAAGRGTFAFGSVSRPRAIVAGAILLYALVAYPLIGWLTGRAPMQQPYLGVVPCPTMIFTIGLLLGMRQAVPIRLLAIPFAWAAVGSVAAVALGVFEDFGMPAAALIAASTFIHLHRSTPVVHPVAH